MTVFALLFIAVASFLVGMFFGGAKMPPLTIEPKKMSEYDAYELTEEYRNFLDYDGSEQ